MSAVYHVTVDCTAEDPAFSVEAVAADLSRLNPASITVDTAGIGKVVLASLQARGLPAKALEKRPRPVLAEVQRIEEISRERDAMAHKLEVAELENRHLKDYQRDIRKLIARLSDDY